MRPFLVPSNLDMSRFGQDADHIAFILDRIYQGAMQGNYNEEPDEYDFDEPVTINMDLLKTVFKEPSPQRYLDQIARPVEMGSRSITHRVSRLVEEVLETDGKYRAGEYSRGYTFTEKYQVPPVEYQAASSVARGFYDADKKRMERIVKEWPQTYRTACEHLKRLTLDISKAELDALIEGIRSEYRQDFKNEFLDDMADHYPYREGDFPPGSEWEYAREKVEFTWDFQEQELLDWIDTKKSRKVMFVLNKVHRVRGDDYDQDYEFPVAGIDSYGRLHHHLSNIPKYLRRFVRMDGCRVVSYDLKTSQPVFLCLTLEKFVDEKGITLADIQQQAEEILDTIYRIDGKVPSYLHDGFQALLRKRSEGVIQDEFKRFRQLLRQDFYQDMIDFLERKKHVSEWWRLSPHRKRWRDRSEFKGKFFFPFLFGMNLSWKTDGIMEYYLAKFPATFTLLWKLKDLTNVCKVYHEKKDQIRSYKTLKKYMRQHCGTYADLSRNMQRIEAKMFFEEILPQVEQPFITVHDCVVVQAGKPSNVGDIIKQTFKTKERIGVEVKYERW